MICVITVLARDALLEPDFGNPLDILLPVKSYENHIIFVAFYERYLLFGYPVSTMPNSYPTLLYPTVHQV